ncbi:MAG TPA: glycoside hydrolase domain-containing protein, partial [Edaphobacter sp.]|nr:glycoside hydrolase domain-containing protein [Edaphobacter sp.]
MRSILSTIGTLLLSALAAHALAQTTQTKAQQHLGFDRNLYPGDATLPALRKNFAFTGYWLNNPPGETTNSWQGKRDVLLRNRFGFLVLFNGRLDAEIQRASRRGTTPAALGRQDAATAIASAQREHFPEATIVFLDQEEGGRLLPEQSAYLFAWTEALAASSYRPGVYLSGQA